MRSKFIYLSGADGTGKSTQAKLLVNSLRNSGFNAAHLWLRYPFILSLPFLAYARIRGLSRYENIDGFRQGYWYFKNSGIMRCLFPWVYLLDAAIASVVFVFFPLLLGKTLVCERYVIDMIVDIMVAIEDEEFYKKLPGSLFFKLLPSNGTSMILDLDFQTILKRRPELRNDKRLKSRLNGYRLISESLDIEKLKTDGAPADVLLSIQERLKR